MSYALQNVTKAEVQRLKKAGFVPIPIPPKKRNPKSLTKSAIQRRITAAQGAQRINRTLGQANFRLPGKDSIQVMRSRAVFEIVYDADPVRLRLAKGILTTDGSLSGFLNWDGHVAAMINAYKYFRVVSLEIGCDIATAPESGVNMSIGYQAGSTAAPSGGALLDNDHAMFITAAQGSGTVKVPRSALLNNNEWFVAANQSIVTQQSGGTDFKSLVPNMDAANQGFAQSMFSAGNITSGVIAYMTINTIIEFKVSI